MQPTRLLIVLPSMRGGGSERVASTLLQHFDRQRFDLHLALAQKTGPYLAELPSDIRVHDLKASRVLHSLVPLLRTVRHLQPDVVLSMVSHMNLAATLTRPTWPRKTRLILRETATCHHLLNTTRWPWLRKRAYRRQYSKADRIICQSHSMRLDLQHSFALRARNLTVIRNPIDIERVDRLADTGRSPFGVSRPDSSDAKGDGPNIVAVASFYHVKGIDRLLAAFPHLLKRRPNANLWLLGEGPAEVDLRRQAAELGITQRVHFVGFQKNPYRWLRAADLLVLPSRHESCSNALLESLACGCPVITLRHPGGTTELLRQYRLSDRIVERLEDWSEDWFAPLASTVQQQIRTHFAAPAVATEYQHVLL